MERNLFGFDPEKRTATLYDNGDGKFDSINIDSLGHIVSSILTRPDDFKNRHVYVSGFTISQNDILEALLKATKTTRDEWTITHRTTDDLRKEGMEKLGKGDFSGALDLIFATVFKAGLGSDFSTTRKLDNEAVGLKPADVVESTKGVLERK